MKTILLDIEGSNLEAVGRAWQRLIDASSTESIYVIALAEPALNFVEGLDLDDEQAEKFFRTIYWEGKMASQLVWAKHAAERIRVVAQTFTSAERMVVLYFDSRDERDYLQRFFDATVIQLEVSDTLEDDVMKAVRDV